ncbi:hypothetical protein [Haloplanus salilacus]
MSHLRIKSDRLNRTIPVDCEFGTIEVDLSGETPTVVLPEDTPVTVERR